jgi:hypothetical protein
MHAAIAGELGLKIKLHPGGDSPYGADAIGAIGMKAPRRLLRVATAIVVSASFSLLPTACLSQRADGSAAHAASADLQQRGKQLRAQINAKYRELEAEHKISARPKNGTDVSEIVMRFIPPGSSFDDAKAILNAAGCRVAPTPMDGKIYANAVVASHFPIGVIFSVLLVPRTPGEFSIVGDINASISAGSV